MNTKCQVSSNCKERGVGEKKRILTVCRYVSEEISMALGGNTVTMLIKRLKLDTEMVC